MRSRKRIITTVTVAVVCVAVLCIGIFYFYSQNREMDAETVALIEKFESYSGKLTPAEQQEFFETAQMLEAKYNNNLLPESEATRLGLRLKELYRINPELWNFDPHANDHAHDTSSAKRAAEIDELVAKVQAMNYPAERKAIILASLEEYRHLSDPTLAKKDRALLLELQKIDPELIGLNRLNTGHILKLYPNTVYLFKKRESQPNGTVREIITGHHASVDSRIDVDTYLDRLGYYSRFRPEGTPMPTPPDGIRFIDIYLDDLPENPIEEVIVAGVDELPDDPKQGKPYTADDHGHTHDYQPDSSIPDATTSGIPHALPEETAVTESDIARERFFEQLTRDEELKRLLEMTDAEFAAELERRLTPQLPTEESVEKELREPSLTGKETKRISPERLEKARAVLNRYGREAGLRRLRESDPEVARQIEQMHRSRTPTRKGGETTPRRNQQKEGGPDKPD